MKPTCAIVVSAHAAFLITFTILCTIWKKLKRKPWTNMIISMIWTDILLQTMDLIYLLELPFIKLQNILLSLNILSPKLIKSISFYGSYVFAFKENSAQVTSNTSCLILIYGLIKERSRPNRISCKSSLAYVFDFLHTSFGLTQTHEMSTL